MQDRLSHGNKVDGDSTPTLSSTGDDAISIIFLELHLLLFPIVCAAIFLSS